MLETNLQTTGTNKNNNLNNNLINGIAIFWQKKFLSRVETWKCWWTCIHHKAEQFRRGEMWFKKTILANFIPYNLSIVVKGKRREKKNYQKCIKINFTSFLQFSQHGIPFNTLSISRTNERIWGSQEVFPPFVTFFVWQAVTFLVWKVLFYSILG